MIAPLGPTSAPPNLRAAAPRSASRPQMPAPGIAPVEETSSASRWLAAGALALAALGAAGGVEAAAPPPAAVSRTTGDHQHRQDLTARLLSHPSLAGEARREVERQLAHLPTKVLETLDGSNVRIAVLAEGQSPVDAGLVGEVVPDRDFADPGALQRQAAGAIQRTEDLYRPRMEKARRADEGSEDGFLADDGEAPILAHMEFRALQQERLDFARRAVQEATAGRVDLVPYYAGELSPGLLRDLAEEHGARTPEEIRRYGDLVRSLNAGRQGTEWPDGPVPAPREALLLPAFHYVRSTENAGETPRLLSTHDWGSHLAWRDGGVLGQYFFHGPANVVALSPRALGQEGREARAVLHELGHAYEDALREKDPARYRPLEEARDRAWGRLADQQDHPFWGLHASSSPSEMMAETFATAYGGDLRPLRQADPQWVRAFESAAPPREVARR